MNMKKMKFIFILLVLVLIFPFCVLADDGETNAKEVVESKEVNLYFFHGNGCPHCEEANTWFEEIEEEYGEYFNLVSYEVWYNADNSELMSSVAEVRKETADGIPYIIVGNQSWSGFNESYKEEILTKIKSEYEQEPAERYDVMNYVESASKSDESNTTKDIIILLVIIGVIAAISTGVVIARKNTN